MKLGKLIYSSFWSIQKRKLPDDRLTFPKVRNESKFENLLKTASHCSDLGQLWGFRWVREPILLLNHDLFDEQVLSNVYVIWRDQPSRVSPIQNNTVLIDTHSAQHSTTHTHTHRFHQHNTVLNSHSAQQSTTQCSTVTNTTKCSTIINTLSSSPHRHKQS